VPHLRPAGELKPPALVQCLHCLKQTSRGFPDCAELFASASYDRATFAEQVLSEVFPGPSVKEIRQQRHSLWRRGGRQRR
jgi:hypothetical protein